jgi:hypothetical protein
VDPAKEAVGVVVAEEDSEVVAEEVAEVVAEEEAGEVAVAVADKQQQQ